MLKMYSALFLVATVLLVGCSKKTRSRYTLNQYEYEAGEMIDYTNTKPKNRQVWTITNEEGLRMELYEGKNPQIVLSLFWSDGLYFLNLCDNEKEQLANVSFSQPFLIKCERANLTIQRLGNGNKNFDVFADGEFMGTSNTSGQLSRSLPSGLRHLRIVTFGEVLKNETIVVGTGSQTYSFY